MKYYLMVNYSTLESFDTKNQAIEFYHRVIRCIGFAFRVSVIMQGNHLNETIIHNGIKELHQ